MKYGSILTPGPMGRPTTFAEGPPVARLIKPGKLKLKN